MGSLGGELEAFYYAFGDTDVYLIVDLPDNVSATALSLLANAEETREIKIIVLIPAEEVDKATEVAKGMSTAYRPPGQSHVGAGRDSPPQPDQALSAPSSRRTRPPSQHESRNGVSVLKRSSPRSGMFLSIEKVLF
jgi:hypothetical protein